MKLVCMYMEGQRIASGTSTNLNVTDKFYMISAGMIKIIKKTFMSLRLVQLLSTY